jgi:hypothetical protein
MAVLREVVIGGQVYDLLFDGAHNERDDDLFREDLRIPEKRDVFGREKTSSTKAVIAALEAAGVPLTLRQIVAVVGPVAANSGMYNLRQRGRLGSRMLPGTQAKIGGQAIKEYWLLPEGTA